MVRFARLFLVAIAASGSFGGCMDRKTAEKAFDALSSSGPRPDEMPVMLNETLPFRYPGPLYTNQVQGNVTLRIYIDSLGTVIPESTSVEETSGHQAFDSAAVKGSELLRYRPAQLGGRPIGVSILLPVYFRHPEAVPLPGDSVLQPRRRAP